MQRLLDRLQDAAFGRTPVFRTQELAQPERFGIVHIVLPEGLHLLLALRGTDDAADLAVTVLIDRNAEQDAVRIRFEVSAQDERTVGRLVFHGVYFVFGAEGLEVRVESGCQYGALESDAIALIGSRTHALIVRTTGCQHECCRAQIKDVFDIHDA